MVADWESQVYTHLQGCIHLLELPNKVSDFRRRHHLCLLIHIVFARVCLYVQICVYIFPFCEDPSLTALGAHFYDLLLTNHISKDPISKSGYILRYGGQDLNI